MSLGAWEVIFGVVISDKLKSVKSVTKLGNGVSGRHLGETLKRWAMIRSGAANKELFSQPQSLRRCGAEGHFGDTR